MSESKPRTRREFIKTVGGVAALAATGSLAIPRLATAEKGSIKLGQIMTTSGIMAGQGIPGMRSAKIAEEVINKSGGILGNKLEIIQEDDELKPDVGVRKFRKLVLEDKVDFVFGTNSTGVGLALVPLANEFRKIFISTSMGDEFTEKNCSPYIFRIGESTSMASRASAYCMCEREPSVKKWAGINPDYVFGRESWAWFKKGMEEKGAKIEIVHEAFAPFGAQDFKPYITAVLESGAEGVFTSAWTGDLINFIKQAKPFGFFDKVKAFVNNTTADAVAMGLGDDMVSFWGEARVLPILQANRGQQGISASLSRKILNLPRG